MATTTSNYVPVELYLRSDYEPDAEYVDGVIEKRPMGELDHVLWQKALIRWFLAREEALRVEVLFELRVQVKPTRYRVPDVVVIDRDLPREQSLTRAPLAVFEIISPQDTMKRALKKLGDYEAMGIPQIWLIDPETKTYYRLVGGNLAPAMEFGVPGDRIHFKFSDIANLVSAPSTGK